MVCKDVLVFCPQENKVVHKFQVNLPKKVFEKTRGGFKSEETKVVVLSATSETLFQVVMGRTVLVPLALIRSHI